VAVTVSFPPFEVTVINPEWEPAGRPDRSTLAVIVAFPVPLVGDTLSQGTVPDTSHASVPCPLLEMVKNRVSVISPKSRLSGVTPRSGVEECAHTHGRLELM
jgi:hypothetical protein